MQIKKSKHKRKCKAIPDRFVGYNACEICIRRGGKCFARKKYERDKSKNYASELLQHEREGAEVIKKTIVFQAYESELPGDVTHGYTKIARKPIAEAVG